MNYDLDEEQEMIKASAHDFLTHECPTSLVRKMVGDDVGYPKELWQKMAGLGWMGLAFPGRYGGSGGSFLSLVVLLEQMGRVCLPGPFFTTIALGGMTILEAGNEAQKLELLPKIVEGRLVVTLALTEPEGGYGTNKVAVKALANGSEYIITGTKVLVPYANVADYIICVAETEKGVTLFLIDGRRQGISYALLKSIAGDKQYEVVFDRVKVPAENILGREGKGQLYLRGVLGKSAVAKCAEMVGGAQQVLEMTVAYVKERVQFGVPVGSFQAVQHHCANMMIDTHISRLLTYQAAWRIAEGLPYAKEGAMAKAWVSDAFKRVTQNGHQCMGGVSVMDEHDMALYSKRAKAAELTLGDADFHRELVASELGL